MLASVERGLSASRRDLWKDLRRDVLTDLLKANVEY